MESLIEKYRQKLLFTSLDFVRSTMQDIDWEARLIGIKGARGVGKTTLLLQYIKLHLVEFMEYTLYVSLDSIWFNNHRLVDLADDFARKGGKYLFLDEVHKYDGWAQELKNIYDDHPQLKIVFTGSSLLEILNARADLSRRAVIYTMQGFSFREYLCIETGINFDRLTLNQILENHVTVAGEIIRQVKPLQYFEGYLKHGYYPFYREQPGLYEIRLGEVINMMLEIELPLLRAVELSYVKKVKQLLAIIAESVPFTPNVSKLSEKIGINRATLLSYLYYLDEIGLTRNLHKEAPGISILQKPSKIYLENTNLIYTFARENANAGNVRETFFANQTGFQHEILYDDYGDFWVNKAYHFEIGGKKKSAKQLKGAKEGFIVADNIEFGINNKIPLWLFGFMY